MLPQTDLNQIKAKAKLFLSVERSKQTNHRKAASAFFFSAV